MGYDHASTLNKIKFIKVRKPKRLSNYNKYKGQKDVWVIYFKKILKLYRSPKISNSNGKHNKNSLKTF